MHILMILLKSLIANTALQQILAPQKTKVDLVEKGVSVAIGGLLGLFAIFFFITGVVLFAIACGLQWDQNHVMEMSGLMVSGLSLIGLALIMILSLIIQQKIDIKKTRPQPDAPKPADLFVQVFETFVRELLKEFNDKKTQENKSNEDSNTQEFRQ